jgi:hypothetical protein
LFVTSYCYQRHTSTDLHQLDTEVYTCNEQYNHKQLEIIEVSGSVLNQNINIAKKLFLNRERGIPTAQVPSIRREEPDSEVPSSPSRNSPRSVTSEQLHLTILDESSKSFPKFNGTGLSVLINFSSPGEGDEPITYLKEFITALTDYLVEKVPDRDLVGLRIRNTENAQDKVVGITLTAVTN